ncbi:MAG: TlpA family protein disulfide reductase [Alphaproteobacteria bacterium]
MLGKRFILSLLAAAALGSAALALVALAPASSGPAGVGAAATGAPPPPLKGEMGDFSYFTAPRPVPPIDFQDARGTALTLADFKGRVVLVNFWATWCAPCVREMPSLDRLEATLGGKDFVVLDLSLDRQGAAAVEPYFAENKLTHLGIYLDPRGQSFRAWQGQGVPTSFVIGRDGLARGVLLGAANWDSLDAVKLIEHFIAEGRAAKPRETGTRMPAQAG